MEIFIVLIIIMNVIGFLLMKSDKQRAVNKQYRISEKTLWTVALLFGAAGMTAAMNTFRHKTKHAQFKYGLPLLTVTELAVLLYFLNELS